MLLTILFWILGIIAWMATGLLSATFNNWLIGQRLLHRQWIISHDTLPMFLAFGPVMMLVSLWMFVFSLLKPFYCKLADFIVGLAGTD